MWRLCIEDDQQNRTVVNLVRKAYTIGRAEDNGIRLTDRNISRKHAVLERDGESWKLDDLGSLTGCLVNDKQVEQKASVDHGDKLRFGDYIVTLTDESRQDETVRARPVETDGAGGLADDYYPERSDRLVVVEGPNVGAQYPLAAKRLLIGRGEECDIALNDTSVSRVHADIEYLPDEQYRISDQDSSNGVRVNGVERQSAVLDTGDVVELGDVFLKFVPKGLSFEVEAPAPVVAKAEDSGTRRAGTSPRIIGATALAGLLIGLLLFVVNPFGGSDEPLVRTSPAEETLAQAEQLYSLGRHEEAHTKLAGLPTSSKLRDSTLYRQIEAAWADAQFERANSAGSEDEERRLLARIASAESIDSLRRKRAARRLQEINAANIHPQDLPKVADEPDSGAGGTAAQVAAQSPVKASPPPHRKPKPKAGPVKPKPKPPPSRVPSAPKTPGPVEGAPKAPPPKDPPPASPTPPSSPPPAPPSANPPEDAPSKTPAPKPSGERIPVRNFPGDD